MKSNFTQALQELTGFEIGREKSENIAQRKESKESKEVEGAFDAGSSFVVETSEFENLDFGISDDSTVITPSMTLMGNLTSNDDIYIQGKVKGDIVTSGNLKAANLIIGNVKSHNMVLDTARVKGTVSADKSIVISDFSIVSGNVSCQNLNLSGKVNGDLNAVDSVALHGDALVVGNITTDLFTTEPGAHIIGCIYAKKSNSEFDIEKIFDFGGDF